MRRIGDEHCLVTRGILIFLIVVVLFGLFLIDGSSIMLTRYRVADLAEQAAFEAAGVSNRTGSESEACEAAETYIGSQSTTAVIVKDGCTIENDEATITVKDSASTIVVKRLDFMSDLAVARTSATSAGPAA